MMLCDLILFVAYLLCGFVVACCLLLILSVCSISSRCSRMEEARPLREEERVLPVRHVR